MDIRELCQTAFLLIQTSVHTFGKDGVLIAIDLAEALTILPEPGDVLGEKMLKDRLEKIVAKHRILRGSLQQYIAD